MTTPCPRCRTPLHQQGGEPIRDCRTCGGRWLPGSHVAAWRDVEATSTHPTNLADDSVAALCPEGHGILRRARLERLGFALDRCPHCKGVWFDHGEWDRLAAESVAEHLAELWDPDKRASRRKAASQARIDEDLESAIGVDAMTLLKATANALDGHPEKSRALAWLHAALD